MALAIDGHNNFSTGGGAGPFNITLTTTNATDIICLSIIYNNFGGAVSFSVSDNSGVTSAWQLLSSVVNGTTIGIQVFYTKSTGTLSGATIAATFTGGSLGFVSMDAWGVSGANISSPFDADSPVTNIVDPLTISTASTNTMVIGTFHQSSNQNQGTGAGWTATNGTSAGANFILTEYQIFSSPQTNLSITESPTGDACAAIGFAIVAAGVVVPAIYSSGINIICVQPPGWGWRWRYKPRHGRHGILRPSPVRYCCRNAR